MKLMDLNSEQNFIWLKLFLKSFNTNMRPSNFIQNNSTLFWCFTLLVVTAFAYEQFSFLFTLKKSLSTERLLICPRDETGSLYITRVFMWRRGLQTVRRFCMPSTRMVKNLVARIFNDIAFETSEHDDVFFLSVVHKTYRSMKFKSMKWSYLTRRRRQCVWTLSIALQNSKVLDVKAEILLSRVSGFFPPSERTLNNFMGRRFNVECVATFHTQIFF